MPAGDDVMVRDDRITCAVSILHQVRSAVEGPAARIRLARDRHVVVRKLLHAALDRHVVAASAVHALALTRCGAPRLGKRQEERGKPLIRSGERDAQGALIYVVQLVYRF